MKTYGRLLITQVALACLCLLTRPPQLTAQDEPKGQDQQQPAQATPEQRIDQPAPVDNTVQPVAPDAAPTGSTDQTAAADHETQELLKVRLGPNYVIGPEDVIELTVFDVSDLQHVDVQVADDGTISVPLLGSIKAAGLSQRQLRDELADLWGKKYLQDPQVSVFIKAFKSRPVSVIGSVAKPGVYYLTARRTLIEVLAMAGGPARGGMEAGKLLFLQRQGGFQDLPQVDGLNQIAPDKISVELKKLIYSQDTQLNIEVKPFDNISVSRPAIIYVAGAFYRPGGYILDTKDEVSVLEAVLMAEGNTRGAKMAQAKIYRRTNSGVMTEIPLNLKKIWARKAPDVTLAANDILYVPGGSRTKGVAQTTTSSVLGIASGLIIYHGL